jgi:hypothetical protein
MKTTLIQAIKNRNFTKWPGLTDNVNKNYQRTIANKKGYMAQTRRNSRSTKPKRKPEEESDMAITEDFAPTYNLPQRSNEVYSIMTELDGKVYTNLTGRFPKTSIKGKKCVLVLYKYDGNAILAEPNKSRADSEAVRAYTVLYNQLTVAGLQPKF